MQNGRKLPGLMKIHLHLVGMVKMLSIGMKNVVDKVYFRKVTIIDARVSHGNAF